MVCPLRCELHPSPTRLSTLLSMERPPPDPNKLLDFWMEWEEGDATPGTVLKNLKNGGMKELLHQLAGRELP